LPIKTIRPPAVLCCISGKILRRKNRRKSVNAADADQHDDIIATELHSSVGRPRRRKAHSSKVPSSNCHGHTDPTAAGTRPSPVESDPESDRRKAHSHAACLLSKSESASPGRRVEIQRSAKTTWLRCPTKQDRRRDPAARYPAVRGEVCSRPRHPQVVEPSRELRGWV